MGWLMRYRWRNYLRNSVWLVPTATIPSAILVFPVLRWIDDKTRWHNLHFTPEGAGALFSAIAPAALTLIVLVLSTLLLSV